MIHYDDIDDKLIVRIVSVYFLVCHKIGQQDLHCLSMLANLLLLMGEVTTSEMLW